MSLSPSWEDQEKGRWVVPNSQGCLSSDWAGCGRTGMNDNVWHPTMLGCGLVLVGWGGVAWWGGPIHAVFACFVPPRPYDWCRPSAWCNWNCQLVFAFMFVLLWSSSDWGATLLRSKKWAMWENWKVANAPKITFTTETGLLCNRNVGICITRCVCGFFFFFSNQKQNFSDFRRCCQIQGLAVEIPVYPSQLGFCWTPHICGMDLKRFQALWLSLPVGLLQDLQFEAHSRLLKTSFQLLPV